MLYELFSRRGRHAHRKGVRRGEFKALQIGNGESALNSLRVWIDGRYADDEREGGREEGSSARFAAPTPWISLPDNEIKDGWNIMLVIVCVIVGVISK